MKAVIYDTFGGDLRLTEVPDPIPADDGVVIQTAASGLCLSDWHGWKGHDPDIRTPHVPGHELAGRIVAVGKAVAHWRTGMRVTLPFACGCGTCEQCQNGQQHICDHHFQPGFTAWGSFAEYVAIPHADVNLVALPDEIDFASASLLGCRVATAFRAVTAQGRVRAGEVVAVHGCGGVGLSAVAIAAAHGARVAAVDINASALVQARALGAEWTIDASQCDPVAAIRDATGGAHLSLDALGSRATCLNSLHCLRKRGRHLQVGLMTAGDTECPLPLGIVIAGELEIIGSHGLQAHAYPALLAMVRDGRLAPSRLIARRIGLDDVPRVLPQMDRFQNGITVIDRF